MTAKKPLVSILMPYYETGQFLAEAVSSVLAQTFANWELIIVDDGSRKCPAADVLATINDARVKLVCHNTNQGIGAARNTAAAHSQGELILPLDSDDLLKNQYIERTLKAILESGACAAYTDVEIFGEQVGIYKPNLDLGEILSGYYPHNTLLLKRELFDSVGGYKSLETAVDTEFWVSIIELGKPFSYIEEPLYSYRKHRQSITSRRHFTYAVNQVKILIEHQESTAKHIQTIIDRRDQFAAAARQTASTTEALPSCNMQAEYEHLHKEFHQLLERYQLLEKQVARNNSILGSLPAVLRQISYLGLKRLGRR